MSGFYEAGKLGHRNQSDIFMPSTGDNDVITVIRHIFAETGESGACLSTGKYFGACIISWYVMCDFKSVRAGWGLEQSDHNP